MSLTEILEGKDFDELLSALRILNLVYLFNKGITKENEGGNYANEKKHRGD
jgi:hypothetical protein